MSNENMEQREQEVTSGDSPKAGESGWSKLDEHDRPPKPAKRKGFTDWMTGGDDEQPIHVVPTG